MDVHPMKAAFYYVVRYTDQWVVSTSPCTTLAGDHHDKAIRHDQYTVKSKLLSVAADLVYDEMNAGTHSHDKRGY